MTNQLLDVAMCAIFQRLDLYANGLAYREERGTPCPMISLRFEIGMANF
jgi:hypothetical protein